MTSSSKYLLPLTSSLALIAAMWAARAFISETQDFRFLFWNLLLAIIPLAISTGMRTYRLRKGMKALCFAVWLLFLPNAPYLVTDLVHLQQRDLIPLWYDAAMLFAAALSGLWIGCISLRQMESLWRREFPRMPAWCFSTGAVLLCGFGVYLGRMLRFNSWDVIAHPFSLLHVLARMAIFPWRYPATWGVTLLFAGMMWVALMQLKYSPGSRRSRPN